MLCVISIAEPARSQDNSLDIYTLIIDLPPDMVNDVTVIYALPQGLVYEPNSLAFSGTPVTHTESIQGSNDGTGPALITWSLGTVDNTADQDIQIQFKAVVANIGSNKDGTLIGPGTAILSWNDPEGTTHGFSAQSDSVEVIEPDLQLDRRFDRSTAGNGDSVTCTLFVRHSANSRADAYDVDLIEALPSGLTYIPGSMEIVAGPEGAKDESGGARLNWHFDQVDRSWYTTKDIQLRYRAKVDEGVMEGSNLTSSAELGWASTEEENSERRTYSRTAESTITIASELPRLNISMADDPDPVSPAASLTYTISYLNRGGGAQDVAVEASYDGGLNFVSADPQPDMGTKDHWTLGYLGNNDSGIVRVTLIPNSSLSEGAVLSSSATISCSEGVRAQASATTHVKRDAPLLTIEKRASGQLIKPGGYLNYTIEYKNMGKGALGNVTVTDIVDRNLIFDPGDSTPRPNNVYTDGEGTHLFWNATTLNAQTLEPGGSGIIELRVSLPSIPTEPTFDSVYNNYKIDSNETSGSFNTLETPVVHSLYVRKTAEKDVYSAGEIVDYTILYGNEVDLPGDAGDATKVAIYDTLPSSMYMEYEGAYPEPTAMIGDVLFWDIGTLRHGESGTIQLSVKLKCLPETAFKSSGSVSGSGFVNIHQDYDTATIDRLINFVNISGYYDNGRITESDSSSATILLADARGTAAAVTGHGSGIYSKEEEEKMLLENRSIQVKTSLSETYTPTSFSLPRGRSISYSSKWSEAQSADNRITGAALDERYMYANKIDRDSTLKLDKNGSTLASETTFEGAGHVNVLKMPVTNETTYRLKDRVPIYDSQEDYVGSFKVYTYLDEYGKNVASNRSVSGVGYAAADKRIGKSQRSYESGTGTYQAEEQAQTVTNYMAKEIDVSYGPMSYTYTPDVEMNLSKKWSEGMSSKSGTLRHSPKDTSSKPASLISEEFYQADSLNKSTVALGLNEMKTEAEFSGIAQFSVAYQNRSANQSSDEVSLYDRYVGKYKLSRDVTVGGVARFDQPHISVFKVGKKETSSYRYANVVDYEITVVNDGNRALGPIYIQDIFPQGTEYVYSSLRPSSISQRSANWTLIGLSIGSSATIELKLKYKIYGDLVNRVEAVGSCNGQLVSATNISVMSYDWLNCCPPQIFAFKDARIDEKDPMLIHYNITLMNRLNSTSMAVTVTDLLPSGLVFLNSSVALTNYSSEVLKWNIIDLKPGETRTIDYGARAQYGGTFVNRADIEVYPTDGTGSAKTDVEASIDVQGEGCPIKINGWPVPACFGLNYTQQYLGDEWMACESCGGAGADFQPQEEGICPSCTSTGESEGGLDVP
jgi:uncharacterized repeat protein (TIGR01451 family)